MSRYLWWPGLRWVGVDYERLVLENQLGRQFDRGMKGLMRIRFPRAITSSLLREGRRGSTHL